MWRSRLRAPTSREAEGLDLASLEGFENVVCCVLPNLPVFKNQFLILFIDENEKQHKQKGFLVIDCHSDTHLDLQPFDKQKVLYSSTWYRILTY